MSKRIASGKKGIYYREHTTRMYKKERDRYWIIRIRINGKRVEYGLGWRSEGTSLIDVVDVYQTLKRNIKLGSGPTSVKELKKYNTQKQEAERKELEKDEAIATLKVVTFEMLAEKFLAWAKATKRTSTSTLYESKLRNHSIPYFASKDVNTITYEDILAFRAHLEEKKSNHKKSKISVDDTHIGKLRPSTVKEILATTRETLNFGAATPISAEFPNIPMYRGQNHFEKKPFKGAKLLPKVETGNKRVLNQEELDLILDEALCDGMNIYHATMIALYTGMRISEIVAIKKEHLQDHTSRRIHVPNTKTTSRTVFYPSLLDDIFDERIDNDSEWLFPSYSRLGHVTSGSISKKFTVIIKQLGINEGITDNRFKATFHTLRSVYAVRMLRHGLSLHNLSKQLGHASIDTTVRNYLPLVEDDLRNEIKKANDNLDNRKK